MSENVGQWRIPTASIVNNIKRQENKYAINLKEDISPIFCLCGVYSNGNK